MVNKKYGRRVTILVIIALAIPLVLAEPCAEDTDGGNEPMIFGRVLCAGEIVLCTDSCSGNTLTECLCVGGETDTTTYDCTLDGMACYGGECIGSACTPGENQSCEREPIGLCSEGIQVCGDDGDWGGCKLSFAEAEDEVCNDEKDNDCDGEKDCDDSDCYFDEVCLGGKEIEEVNETDKDEDDEVEKSSGDDEVANETELICGPRIDDIFTQELNDVGSILRLYDDKWGWWPASTWRRTEFMADNGMNIDFYASGVSEGDISCPAGKECRQTIWLCGRCMPPTTANNILYGFVAERIGLSRTLSHVGAHVHNIWDKGKLDGDHALAAYCIGELLAKKHKRDGYLTSEDICHAVTNTSLLFKPSMAIIPHKVKAINLMRLSGRYEVCNECPLGDATDAWKTFSGTYPWDSLPATEHLTSGDSH